MSGWARSVRIAVVALLLAAPPVSAADYYFDTAAAAETSCGTTTTTNVTRAVPSGSLVTRQGYTVNTATDYHLSLGGGGTWATYADDMYSPPAAQCTVLSGALSARINASMTFTTRPSWQVRVYDVDPGVACATGTLIGQSAWTAHVGATRQYGQTDLTIPFSTGTSYTLALGHRLRFEVWFRGNTTISQLKLQFGSGTTTTSWFKSTTEAVCAVPGTTIGAVTATPSGCNGISVSAPYTGDSDGDNTLSYRTRSPAGTGTWSTSSSRPHSASPYAFALGGLAQGSSYDVEVTFADVDGLSGSNGQIVTVTNVGAACLAAGTATAAQTTGSTPSVAITAPYSFDTNGTSSLSYRYRLSPSGTYTTPVGVAYMASPYRATAANLTCGASYDVEVTYLDADGIASGTAVQAVASVPVNACTAAGTATATVDACSQIRVQAPFTQDSDADGAVLVERGDAATGPWTTVAGCAALGGASPRTCTDTTVVSASTYHYRVTYSDVEGVGGTAQQVLGPFSTPVCADPAVNVGAVTATATGCGAVQVSAAFTGDSPMNSSTRVEWSTTGAWPGTVACAALTGASPRVCNVTGLPSEADVQFRVTFTDADGVTGTNPSVLVARTPACGLQPLGATATATACNSVSLRANFSGDTDGDSTTAFRRGDAAAGPFGTTVCAAVTGASPRACTDATVLASRTYYYQVDHADADGVGTGDLAVVSVAVPACPPVVTLGTPAAAQPAGTTVAAGASALVGRFTLSASAGTVSVTSIGISNLGTAVAGSDIARLQLFNDATNALLATTTASGAVYRASGLSVPVAAGTPLTVRVVATVAPGATTGRTFRMRATAAEVTAVNATISGGPIDGNATVFTTGAGALSGNANNNAPSVLILNPTAGAVSGPSFRVQVQVHNPAGIPSVTAVELSTNNGSTFATPLAQNPNYFVGLNAAIYEASVTLAPGSYALIARATNVAALQTRSTPVSLVVNGNLRGDGNLLVRDNSSQLCSDCHALQTHSSAAMGTEGRYGAWAVGCRDCHTPHSTTNAGLIKKNITPPSISAYQPTRTARFATRTGYNATATAAAMSYANADNSGPCQVCHTRTTGPGTKARFRNSGNADLDHHASPDTQSCLECHKHENGFRGQLCDDCHLGTGDVDNHVYGDGVVARIDQTDWNAAGHGAALAYPSGNAGAAFDAQGATRSDRGCAYCHKVTAKHADPANPKRLANLDLGANGPCLVCHDKNQTGYDPDGADPDYAAKTAGKRVDNDHIGLRHSSPPNHNGGNLCWDCHDPHGDRSSAGNALWFMFQQRPVEHRDAAGVPQTLAAAIEFRANLGGSLTAIDYPDYIAASGGVCRVCHDPYVAGSPPTGAAHFNKTTSDGHNTANGTSSRNRCVDCHVHSQGCSTCHVVPPTTGKHGKHLEVAFATTDYKVTYTDATLEATATQYGFKCAKCHSGQHASSAAGTVADPFDIQVLFDSTVDPKNPSGLYTPGAAQTPTLSNGKYYGWTNGSCSSVYCHSNAAPLGGTNTYVAPSWAQVTGVTCTSCHAGAGAATTLSPAHRIHTDPARYNLACVRCHAATMNVAGAIGNKALHVNGLKDVAFDTSGPNNSAATYDATGHTCSGAYCHSAGTVASAPYPTAPVSLAWNQTKTCASCHGAGVGMASVISSGTHASHVNNAALLGTNLSCQQCHGTVVTGSTAISDFTRHVNQLVEVSTTPAVTWAKPTCTGGCHASGQAATVVQNYSVSWTAGTTLGCAGCHGRHTDNAFTAISGEPNYTNGGAGTAKANSHRKHVTSGASCASCHDATSRDGATIVAGSALHVNGARNVDITPTKDLNGATSNYDAATKTCNSVGCHGSAGTPVWGGTLTCLGCHGGTEGGALGDGTPNGVAADWTRATNGGHGGTAGGSLTSANGGCDYCHDLSASHTPTAATNPYRLRYSATTNALCLQCHNPGDAGISANSAGTALTAKNSTLNPGNAHDGTKHAAGEGGLLCWDCHDPHGSTNLEMIKTNVSRTSTAYGVPVTTGVATFTDKTAGVGVGRYVEATNSPRRGICQTCHDPAKTLTQSTKYWRWDGTDDADGAGGAAAVASAHNASSGCLSCHPHDKKFAPAAGGDCLSCHGASTQGARRAVTADFGTQSHHVGNGSIMGGTLTNYDCVVCHAEGVVEAGPAVNTNPTWHMNGTIDLKNADTPATVYSYDKAAITTSATSAVANWNSGNAVWAAQQQSNMDPFCLSCHDSNGATATFAANNGGTATNPFGDAKITNNYDQATRPAVVDIKSKVTSGGSDLDVTNATTGEIRGPDTRPDPPQGIYARHAITGQSVSVYGGTNTNWDTTTYWNRTKKAWASNSTMACADCHTNDGANGATGNAHGSGSEYLLKDASGGAAEGTKTLENYVCYLCHAVAAYQSGSAHTANGGDYQDYTANTAAARVPSGNTGGNVYGTTCTNCHGGVVNGTGAQTFGTIHGTSQLMKYGSAGGLGTRPAYRFLNGNSLRFYDPQGWTGGSGTCYTLSTADSFGGCTKHGGSGGGLTKPAAGQRPLKY